MGTPEKFVAELFEECAEVERRMWRAHQGDGPFIPHGVEQQLLRDLRSTVEPYIHDEASVDWENEYARGDLYSLHVNAFLLVGPRPAPWRTELVKAYEETDRRLAVVEITVGPWIGNREPESRRMTLEWTEEGWRFRRLHWPTVTSFTLEFDPSSRTWKVDTTRRARE